MSKPTPPVEGKQHINPGLLSSLHWRCIGPYRGGRVNSVAGDPSNPLVFYQGSGGGIWKTYDGGSYWENISDGWVKTSVVGAIAVSSSNPEILYAGMGESCIAVPRLEWTSRTDGVYKSMDGGKSWNHIGLEDSWTISRIRIHPKNPNLVYVAVQGLHEGPHKERGIFRSKNGGETWDHILYRGDTAGAADLSMDPNNPDILYAAVWETQRGFWNSYSGGPDSSLYKSMDGGDTWSELTNNPGIPETTLGRIGVSCSPVKDGLVWAIIECEDGGVFRSENGGDTWQRVQDYENFGLLRPNYYNHILADPHDPETVYVIDQPFWKSTDSGQTFTHVETPHYDHHDLWIDEKDPQRMIIASDGGACVSFDGAQTWSSIYNQPTAEFYHIDTDNQFPYRVYGSQQDNSGLSIPSRSELGAILFKDCYNVGRSESGHIVVKPDNPDIVYSSDRGSPLFRYDHSTKQVRWISVWPDLSGWTIEDRKYRFAYNCPITISPHDPNILYTAANVVFRSTDEGSSWEILSPDLTRNDPVDREAFDPRTNIAPFEGCSICRFVESPHEKGIFWAGSDDGLIHISRDGGKTWRNVTPKQLPEWTPITGIEISPHNPSTTYVSATRYQFGDFLPYLFKTEDYGETWKSITSGIPERDYTRVIREDPGRSNLLYVGTEGGVYVSFNGGDSWQSLDLNLPHVPIHDIAVKDTDLVIATNGRSIWILDDLTVLHQVSENLHSLPDHLFKPRPAYRIRTEADTYQYLPPTQKQGKQYQLDLGIPGTSYTEITPEGRSVKTYIDAGQNPDDGVVVHYYFKETPDADITLSFLDSDGQEIISFSSNPMAKSPRLRANPGSNKFVWNMRYPGHLNTPIKDQNRDHEFPEEPLEKNLSANGPLASPGTYTVRLSTNNDIHHKTFEILKDPRASATQTDLEHQFNFLVKIRDKISEANQAVADVREIIKHMDEWCAKTKQTLEISPEHDTPDKIKSSLLTIENQLAGTGDLSWVDERRRATFYSGGLISRMCTLADRNTDDGAPPKQFCEVFTNLSSQVDIQIQMLKNIIANDIEMLIS